jgi:hypothetical protein
MSVNEVGKGVEVYCSPTWLASLLLSPIIVEGGLGALVRTTVGKVFPLSRSI